MTPNTTHDSHKAMPPQPPPHLLARMADWQVNVAWSHIADVTTWRLRSPGGDVRYLKVARLGWEQRLTAEHERLVWAAGRLPVPPVLDYGCDDEREWLLTAGLAGVNATDERLRADPARLVPQLAAGLRQFHAVPFADCPFDSRLGVMIESARQRVAAGLVDAERDLHRDHGDITAEEALAQLLRLRPRQEDLVVCHGDYCLPNVLICDGRVSGYVDLGQLGVADRWSDLATATWSVTWNLGPGWEDLFLDAYGVERDADMLAFYRLLYDLTP